METLVRLEKVISERLDASTEVSYVAKLNSQGIDRIAQKLGEEATETVVAALSGRREEVVRESADLLFHLLLLLQARRVTLDEVMAELERREGKSGIDEKANREEG